MADVLGDALAVLSSKMTANAGTSVTYSRPSTSQSVTLAAVSADVQIELLGTDEIETVRAESRDWLIETADLVLGGAAALPAVGDTVADGSRTYLVCRFGGDSHYRFCDPQRSMVRVHSKLKS